MAATVLELDLTAPLLDAPPADPVAAVLARRRPLLRDLVDGLRLAREDPSVVGLVAHIGAGPHLTDVQELRDAVRAFAASGKTTVAWTESFGEMGHGTVPYYLATAFDEIWLQPSGSVGLTGVSVEAMFAKDALAKAGLVPQIGQRKEYKNAPSTALESGMTEAHREATSRMVASTMERVRAAVADRRGLTAERVIELVDDAPLTANRALENGLVDHLGYRDEVYAALGHRFGDLRLRYLSRYVHHTRRARTMEPAQLVQQVRNRLRPRRTGVALIHALGNIHLGRSTRRPMGGHSVGSDSLGAALRAAARSDDVTAVVLRVDSGGGSHLASDAIRREVLRLREAGKPVICSMGRYAASGGYFIAMGADQIVAQPGTLTGSIGVFGGKVVVHDLLKRFGVNVDGVAEGRNAAMFSAHQTFSDEEWARLNEYLDEVYADFTGKVAADRGLATETVEQLARGRVWTGADAHQHGLVDELGGLDRAVDLACERAGLARDDADVHTVPRLGFLEQLRPAESSEDLPAATARIGGWRGPGELLAELLGVSGMGVLSAPTLYEIS